MEIRLAIFEVQRICDRITISILITLADLTFVIPCNLHRSFGFSRRYGVTFHIFEISDNNRFVTEECE